MAGEIGRNQLIWMAITAAVLMALPVFALFLWRRRARESWLVVLAGALSFVLFSKVLEAGVHVYCIVQDNPISRAITGNVFLFTLYGCAMAGIFEEVGRYLIFRFPLRRQKNPQAAIGYGIGHGGIEVYVNVVAQVILMIVLSLRYNKGGAEAIGSAGAAMAASTAAGFSAVTTVLFVAERIFAMAFHVAMSVVVFAAARQKSPSLLLLAILTHGVIDIPAALYQYGVINIYWFEALFAVLIIAACGMSVKYWGQLSLTFRYQKRRSQRPLLSGGQEASDAHPM